MFRLQAARLGRAVSVAVGGMAAGTAGGCAQLVGIDNTELAGNSVQLVRTSIGVEVVQAPLDLEGLSATYLVPGNETGNGATRVERVTATAGVAGRWTSQLRAPAPVEVTLPDVPTPIPRLYDLPSQHLRASFDVLEHPGRTAAPDGAMFAVTVPLDTAPGMADTFQVYAVGAWLTHDLVMSSFDSGTMQLAAQPFGFALPDDSVPRRPQIDRVTTQDAFLVLRHAGAPLTGVAEATPFDQADATTLVTTGAMTPVMADQMLAVKIATSALLGRFASVQPAVAPPVASWALTAAPGAAMTSNTGPFLQSATLDATATELTVAYGNPFIARNWPTVFTLAAVGRRPFMLPGMVAGTMSKIDLEAGFVALVAPPAQPRTELPVSAGAAAGIPVGITMNRTLLSTDGQEVKQPTGLVEVTFSLDKLPEAPGAVRYFVLVQELVPGPADLLERHLVFVAASTEPRFSLSANVFQAGHNYTLRALSTLGGFTGADAGDLVSRSLPLTEGFLDSAVIRVVP